MPQTPVEEEEVPKVDGEEDDDDEQGGVEGALPPPSSLPEKSTSKQSYDWGGYVNKLLSPPSSPIVRTPAKGGSTKYDPSVGMGTRHPVAEKFRSEAAKQGVDPDLVESIAEWENRGVYKDRTSKKAAAGYGQVIPSTWAQYGGTPGKEHDPDENIRVSVKIMKDLADRYGNDPAKVAIAYNAGPGTLEKYLAGKTRLPQETQQYIPGVQAIYARLKGQTQAPSQGALPPPQESEYSKLSRLSGGDPKKIADAILAKNQQDYFKNNKVDNEAIPDPYHKGQTRADSLAAQFGISPSEHQAMKAKLGYSPFKYYKGKLGDPATVSQVDPGLMNQIATTLGIPVPQYTPREDKPLAAPGVSNPATYKAFKDQKIPGLGYTVGDVIPYLPGGQAADQNIQTGQGIYGAGKELYDSYVTGKPISSGKVNAPTASQYRDAALSRPEDYIAQADTTGNLWEQVFTDPTREGQRIAGSLNEIPKAFAGEAYDYALSKLNIDADGTKYKQAPLEAENAPESNTGNLAYDIPANYLTAKRLAGTAGGLARIVETGNVLGGIGGSIGGLAERQGARLAAEGFTGSAAQVRAVGELANSTLTSAPAVFGAASLWDKPQGDETRASNFAKAIANGYISQALAGQHPTYIQEVLAFAAPQAVETANKMSQSGASYGEIASTLGGQLADNLAIVAGFRASHRDPLYTPKPEYRDPNAARQQAYESHQPDASLSPSEQEQSRFEAGAKAQKEAEEWNQRTGAQPPKPPEVVAQEQAQAEAQRQEQERQARANAPVDPRIQPREYQDYEGTQTLKPHSPDQARDAIASHRIEIEGNNERITQIQDAIDKGGLKPADRKALEEERTGLRIKNLNLEARSKALEGFIPEARPVQAEEAKPASTNSLGIDDKEFLRRLPKPAERADAERVQAEKGLGDKILDYTDSGHDATDIVGQKDISIPLERILKTADPKLFEKAILDGDLAAKATLAQRKQQLVESFMKAHGIPTGGQEFTDWQLSKENAANEPLPEPELHTGKVKEADVLDLDKRSQYTKSADVKTARKILTEAMRRSALALEGKMSAGRRAAELEKFEGYGRKEEELQRQEAKLLASEQAERESSEFEATSAQLAKEAEVTVKTEQAKAKKERSAAFSNLERAIRLNEKAGGLGRSKLVPTDIGHEANLENIRNTTEAINNDTARALADKKAQAEADKRAELDNAFATREDKELLRRQREADREKMRSDLGQMRNQIRQEAEARRIAKQLAKDAEVAKIPSLNEKPTDLAQTNDPLDDAHKFINKDGKAKTALESAQHVIRTIAKTAGIPDYVTHSVLKIHQRLRTDPDTGLGVKQDIRDSVANIMRTNKGGSYAKFELVNGAALNSEFKNPLATNDVMAVKSAILNREMQPLREQGYKVDLSRSNGLSIAATSDAPSALLSEYAAKAQEAFDREVVKPNGYDKLLHPKGELDKSGSGIEFAVADIPKQSDIARGSTKPIQETRYDAANRLMKEVSDKLDLGYIGRAERLGLKAENLSLHPEGGIIRPTRPGGEPSYVTADVAAPEEGGRFLTPAELITEQLNKALSGYEGKGKKTEKAALEIRKAINSALIYDELLESHGKYLGSTEREITGRRLIEQVDQAGGVGHYIEMDLRNVGGLNNIAKHYAELIKTGQATPDQIRKMNKFGEEFVRELEATGPSFLNDTDKLTARGFKYANEIIENFGDRIAAQLNPLQGEHSISIGRQGGDEFYGMGHSYKPEFSDILRERMERATDDISDYIDSLGLSELPHPKNSLPGSGILFDISRVIPAVDGDTTPKRLEKLLGDAGNSIEVQKDKLKAQYKEKLNGQHGLGETDAASDEQRVTSENDGTGSPTGSESIARGEGASQDVTDEGANNLGEDGERPPDSSGEGGTRETVSPQYEPTSTESEATSSDNEVDKRPGLGAGSALRPEGSQGLLDEPALPTPKTKAEADLDKLLSSDFYKKKSPAEQIKILSQKDEIKGTPAPRLDRITTENGPEGLTRTQVRAAIATHRLLDAEGREMSLQERLRTADEVLYLMDAFAASTGKDIKQWYKDTFKAIESDYKSTNIKRRADIIIEQGQALKLRLYRTADASTLLHEFVHIMRSQFDAVENQTLKKFLKEAGVATPGRDFSDREEEYIARAVENYMRHNEIAPDAPQGLKRILTKLSKVVTGVYARLQSTGLLRFKFDNKVQRFFDDIRLNEAAKDIFDRRFIEGRKIVDEQRRIAEAKRAESRRYEEAGRKAAEAPLGAEEEGSDQRGGGVPPGRGDNVPLPPPERIAFNGTGKAKERKTFTSAKDYYGDVDKLPNSAKVYGELSNKETALEAKARIIANEDNAFEEAINPNGGALEQEMAIQLMRKATLEGDEAKKAMLFDVLAKRATAHGQAIQILSRLANISPDSIQQYAQRMLDKYTKPNVKAKIDELSAKLDRYLDTGNMEGVKTLFQSEALPKAGMKEIYNLANLRLQGAERAKRVQDIVKKYKDVPFIDEATATKIHGLSEELAKATDDRQKEVLTAKINEAIISKVNPDIFTKLSEFTSIAKLLNPQSIVKNLLAHNTYLVGLEMPKDILRAMIDSVVALKTKKRTAVVPSLKVFGEGAKTGMANRVEDIKENIDTRHLGHMGGTAIKGKVWEAANKTYQFLYTTVLAGVEKGAFNEAYDNQLRAAKLNKEPITEAMKAKFKERAYQEADEKALMDNSTAARAFIALRKALNGNKPFGLGDVVLKFAKVPANVLARGVEYSGGGFVRAAYELARPSLVKRGYAGERGETPEFRQRQFADTLARGIWGQAMLVGLGALLSHAGILTQPSQDKNKRRIEEEAGEYGPRIHLPGGASFSIQGLDPIAFGLNVGADMYHAYKSGGKGLGEQAQGVIMDYIDSMGTAISDDPIIKNIREKLGDKNTALSTKVGGVASSMASLFVPTLLTQVRKLADPISREHNMELAGSKAFGSLIYGLMDQLPVASEQLPERLDSFGHPLPKRSTDYPVLSSFLDPFKASSGNADKEHKQAMRLSNEIGTVKGEPYLPAPSSPFITVNKEKVPLSDEQRRQRSQFIGSNYSKAMDEAENSPSFKALTPEQKAKVLADNLKTIKAKADQEVTHDPRLKKDAKAVPVNSQPVFDHNNEVDAKRDEVINSLTTNERTAAIYNTLDKGKQQKVKEDINRLFAKAKIKEEEKDSPQMRAMKLREAQIHLKELKSGYAGINIVRQVAQERD